MLHDIFESAIGVDLGGTKVLLRYRDHALRLDTGPVFSAADLTALVQDFVDRYVDAPCVLGIAVPGLVDNDHVVACDVLPGLAGWNAAALSGQSVRGVSLVNDAKAALQASVRDLAEGKTAITVMAGTAIGCGIMVDGKVLQGARGWAGELGYWPVRTSALQWARLDELAGGRYMADRLGVEGSQLSRLAQQGDPAALEVIAEGGRALGSALAGMINLFNPHRLSIGGGAMRLPGYWEATRASILAHALSSMLTDCEIRTVHEVEDLVATGAADYALRAMQSAA